jgi:hypothetical protein
VAGEKVKKRGYQTTHGGGRPWSEREDPKKQADVVRARPHEHLGLRVDANRKKGSR